MKTTPQAHLRRSSLFTLALLALGAAVTLPASSQAQTEIAHWTLDESGSPYANTDNAAAPLLQDATTSAAGTGAGIAGNAAFLHFVSGTATRLATAVGPQTSNSFGFSFFVQPGAINAFDSFIQKETTTTSATDGFAQLAWQVHVLGSNGGFAPVELVVRGQGTGFAGLDSAATIPLNTGTADYYNIAGGYNATTGALTLYVRDMTAGGPLLSYSGTGDTGLVTSDAAPFSLGTGKYNGNAVQFAATTYIDEVRLYNGPLTQAQVLAIEAAVPEPNTVLGVSLAAGLILIGRRARRQSA